MLRSKSTVGIDLFSAESVWNLDGGFLWRHPQSLDELWNLTTTVILVNPLGHGHDAVRALLLLGSVSPRGNHLLCLETARCLS